LRKAVGELRESGPPDTPRYFVAVFHQQLRLCRTSLTVDSHPPDHPFGPVTCLIV